MLQLVFRGWVVLPLLNQRAKSSTNALQDTLLLARHYLVATATSWHCHQQRGPVKAPSPCHSAMNTAKNKGALCTAQWHRCKKRPDCVVFPSWNTLAKHPLPNSRPVYSGQDSDACPCQDIFTSTTEQSKFCCIQSTLVTKIFYMWYTVGL